MPPSIEELERLIERALEPGRFIPRREVFAFLNRLEDVQRQVQELATASPEGARQGAEVLQTFIGAVHEKADEFHDSGGLVSLFVEDLFAAWVGARRLAGLPEETTAEFLCTWIADDPHGFCLRLDKRLPAVMNAAHLDAFTDAARVRLARSAPDDRSGAGYPRRRWTEVLKTIFTARNRAGDYLRLCGKAPSGEDCLALAKIFHRRKKDDQAMEWVERGLSDSSRARAGRRHAHELEKLRRQLLLRMGRSDEVIDAIWQDFERFPSVRGLSRLQDMVSSSDWATWFERARGVVVSADLAQAVPLLLHFGDIEALAQRISEASAEDLALLPDFVSEPAAETLRPNHPAVAARLYEALAASILDAKRSKAYPYALQHLEQCRDALHEASRPERWSALVEELRTAHRRKVAFMPGFERLVADENAATSDFLTRAKKRWRS